MYTRQDFLISPLPPSKAFACFLMNSREFHEFGDQFHVQGMREKGSLLGRFWLSYFELCELMLNLIYASRTGSWELYLSCIEEVIPWAFAYNRQNYARYLIPFLVTCVICQSECRRCTQPSTKVIFPFRWGAVILSNETKLTLIATAKREEVTSGLVLILPRLRDGCSMKQGVMFTGSFFVCICLLLHPRPTSIRSWLQHALKKTSKL